MLNFRGVLEGGHVTRIQWKVRPGFFVAQMIFRVQTIIQTSKLQWFVMVMTAVECTQAYNIRSVGSMCQRKNGGTLVMVPLIINPIYTSHSGYLFFQGLLAGVQQLGAHHLKGFPTIFPMNVWILLDKFQPSTVIAYHRLPVGVPSLNPKGCVDLTPLFTEPCKAPKLEGPRIPRIL